MRTTLLSGLSLILCLASAQEAKDDGLRLRNDPAGFSMMLPGGWLSEGGSDGHVYAHSVDKMVFVYALPFHFSQSIGASDTIGPLVIHLSKLFPGAQLSDQNQVSTHPDEVTATAAFTAESGPAEAWVLCYVNGPVGMLYAYGCPSQRFAELKPKMLRVLGSLKYTAKRTAESAAEPGHNYLLKSGPDNPPDVDFGPFSSR